MYLVDLRFLVKSTDVIPETPFGDSFETLWEISWFTPKVPSNLYFWLILKLYFIPPIIDQELSNILLKKCKELEVTF